MNIIKQKKNEIFVFITTKNGKTNNQTMLTAFCKKQTQNFK